MVQETLTPKPPRKTQDAYKYQRIMRRKLGRPLMEKEIVHHIDGNHDNDDENNLLVVRNQRTHFAYHKVKKYNIKLYNFIINNLGKTKT